MFAERIFMTIQVRYWQQLYHKSNENTGDDMKANAKALI